ncbi:mitochondrial genome maintenance exonuclease 1-like [Condylostylus longicornis]|uniref:mitochondrial genome maintenance exonuclease 1-like n=1 Tax=Condylostylus longicornis TaxID=2530218 RepID=UPI00244E477C|nr:mitochondrial genome maintenance exonuclease 1-like [Condylostylus longicornis]
MKLLTILNYASKIKTVPKIAKSNKVYDTEKLRKADAIKQLNKENKLLFGPVIKKKIKGKEKIVLKKATEEVSQDNSSEFYWLIKHQSVTEEKTDKNLEKLETNPVNIELNNNLNKTNETQEIPFSSKAIKQMFNFPLILRDDKKNLIEFEEKYETDFPSVTKILSLTMSENARNALIEWKLSKIKELGEEGFFKLQQEHFRKGKELHQSLETYLKSNIEPSSETEVFTTWKSISPILKELNPKAHLIEARVEHPFLKYKGVVDCVLHIGTNLSVIEWKKSDKLKPTPEKTYDAPIQLAAYLGALNSDPKYKLSIGTGYVVVAYTNGKPGNLFQFNEIDMQKYWQLWLKRLQEFWIRTRDGTLPDPI